MTRGSTTLTAPFPFFGGKRRWAEAVWQRFGYVEVYSEPFAGSLAVLLANPCPAQREVVADTNGYICNFWRAVSEDPEQVAHYADYPSIHQDLTARHKWLKRWALENGKRVTDDADWFDAKAAGWWVWGMSLWIGGGWCTVEKEQVPHVAKEITGQGTSKQRKEVPHDCRPLVEHKLGGRKVSKQRKADSMPKLLSWVGGVGTAKQRDQLPRTSDWLGGQGVAKQRTEVPAEQRPRLNNKDLGGIGVAKQCKEIPRPHDLRRGNRLIPWFLALQERLSAVVIINRNWTSIVTPTVLADTPSGPKERITRAVFLDPPYRTEKRKDTLYQSDKLGTSNDTAVQSYLWAVENGNRYKIAYCAHEGDFEVPEGWEALTSSFGGRRNNRVTRDLIMFSPACSRLDEQQSLF